MSNIKRNDPPQSLSQLNTARPSRKTQFDFVHLTSSSTTMPTEGKKYQPLPTEIAGTNLIPKCNSTERIRSLFKSAITCTREFTRSYYVSDSSSEQEDSMWCKQAQRNHHVVIGHSWGSLSKTQIFKFLSLIEQILSSFVNIISLIMCPDGTV